MKSYIMDLNTPKTNDQNRKTDQPNQRERVIL